GDLLAIMSAGAYGMSMSSNYNTRARAAEVMIDGDRFHVIRQRETMEQLMAGEVIPLWHGEHHSPAVPVPATAEKA
ncbi:MAG TPA: hypothetical protein VFI43_07005, partial [Nitrosospira sp.]|nr:hypothetical protein [Nitrosospira sp.]